MILKKIYIIPTTLAALLLCSSIALATNASSVKKIDSMEVFKTLGFASGGTINVGTTVKFLIDNRKNKPGQRPVYFINSRRFDKHRKFATHKGLFSGESKQFEKQTYYAPTASKRKFFAGRLQHFSIKDEQGQNQEFFGLRFIETDVISGELVKIAVQTVAAAFNVPHAKFAFIINSNIQKIGDTTWANGEVAFLTISEILGDLPYLTRNAGMTLGYLKVRPGAEGLDRLTRVDIPLFETPPLDLPYVAGSITTTYQDDMDHVNIRSKERGTPNLILRDKGLLEKYEALANKPVKFEVRKNGTFEISELIHKNGKNPDEQIWAFHKLDQPKKWTHVGWEHGTIESFDNMCRDQSPLACLRKGAAFGGKASSLGFLAHKEVVGPGADFSDGWKRSEERKFKWKQKRFSPIGFGIPVNFYHDFIEANPQIKKFIVEIIQREQTPTPAGTDLAAANDQTRADLEKLKDMILSKEAIFPLHLLDEVTKATAELRASVKEVYGDDVYLDKLKVRSSANVEDIDNFNGAGLHGSYSAEISKVYKPHKNCKLKISIDEDTGLNDEKVKPASMGCVIKAAYASLWSYKAVKERLGRGFFQLPTEDVPQSGAVMGLAVHPTYKFLQKRNILKAKIAIEDIETNNAYGLFTKTCQQNTIERDPYCITANSVYVTRVVGAPQIYGHQISTQFGNGLVTNPVEGRASEFLSLVFPKVSNMPVMPPITVRRYAQPVPNWVEDFQGADEKRLVMSDEILRKHWEIAKAVEYAYCRYHPDYAKETHYPDKCKYVHNSQRKMKALDMEFKTFENGEVLIKQVRTYSGK